MDTHEIVIALDMEIDRLRTLREALLSIEQGRAPVKSSSAARKAASNPPTSSPKKRGRPVGSKNKTMSSSATGRTMGDGSVSPKEKARVAEGRRARTATLKTKQEKAGSRKPALTDRFQNSSAAKTAAGRSARALSTLARLSQNKDPRKAGKTVPAGEPTSSKQINRGKAGNPQPTGSDPKTRATSKTMALKKIGTPSLLAVTAVSGPVPTPAA